MQVRIWGTRGSYPVARPEMLRYGGNTTCVEVLAGETHLILDAGTGMRPLGDHLVAQQFRGPFHLLITHTHWDHIVGFPFFAPLYHADTRLQIYGLQRTRSSLRTTIANALSDPLLPVGLEDLRADLHFEEIVEGGTFVLPGGVKVRAARTNHPYRALGYRIEYRGRALVFIPDTGPFHTVLFGDDRVEWSGAPTPLNEQQAAEIAQMRANVVELARDADWMIFDAQFTEAQYARFPHWGHSTPRHGIEIADEAGVKELLLFHHDPHHTDAQIDTMLHDAHAIAPASLRVRAAYEGMLLGEDHR